MAHNLNYNEHTGKHSFFSVQQKAWHNLGQIVDQYPTSAEAMKFAGLDFQVEKKPNIHRISDEIETVSDSSFFTYRTDNNQVLGTKVGADYEIVQNSDAFTFFDSIVGGGDGILYETAGALNKGERVFITAKLPDYIRIGSGDDVIEKYIFLTTSHDGLESITAAFTPVRIVCQNTLNAALANMSNVIRIRHTAGVKERLEDAHRIMGLANRLAPQLEAIFNNWAKVRVTDSELKKLIRMAMCPNKETLEALQEGKDEDLSAYFQRLTEDAFSYSMLAGSQQMQTTKGTLFGAYNAITGYYQNVQKYKDDDVKLKSILYGGTAQKRAQQAFNACLNYTNN